MQDGRHTWHEGHWCDAARRRPEVRWERDGRLPERPVISDARGSGQALDPVRHQDRDMVHAIPDEVGDGRSELLSASTPDRMCRSTWMCTATATWQATRSGNARPMELQRSSGGVLRLQLGDRRWTANVSLPDRGGGTEGRGEAEAGWGSGGGKREKGKGKEREKGREKGREGRERRGEKIAVDGAEATSGDGDVRADGGRHENAAPPWKKTMKSSNCWPKYQRRPSDEPPWPGQEQSRKNRNLRTKVSRAPDTRKILFQNVTFLGHKGRTWSLSDHMDYDLMGVAEHHLDVANAAEEGGTPVSGRIPLDLGTCQANIGNSRGS